MPVDPRGLSRELVAAVAPLLPNDVHVFVDRHSVIWIRRGAASVGRSVSMDPRRFWEWVDEGSVDFAFLHVIEELADAISDATGEAFPAFPAPGRAAVSTENFAVVSDGAVHVGWRRNDGWQLALPPIALPDQHGGPSGLPGDG